MAYKSEQRARGENLIQSGLFGADMGGGIFKGKPRSFVLQNGQNNLYSDIRIDALDYFRLNKVSWWGGYGPTGHVLSSQIASLNHLFPIRQEKERVLNLLKTVSNDFVDVFPIAENMQGYIQFEAVGGDVNFLNEGNNSRGSNCTSIDALIYALHKNGKRFLIPIEWKYVEAYGNENKSLGEKGATRKARYISLIESSSYLNSSTFFCCWYEPFYQLMRQTLWAEQVIKNKVKGIEADDYLHLHIIPDGNSELLNKKYPCSGKGMVETWKGCLKNPDKYMVVSPARLFGLQEIDAEIYKYLQHRYW